VSIALGVIAIFVLTAATGWFVAMEFAYVTADRLELEQRAREGDRKSARAVRVMERVSFMLSGAQLGITVTALVVGFIAKPALADLIAPGLRAIGVPGAAVGGIAVALGFALATIVQMVLGPAPSGRSWPARTRAPPRSRRPPRRSRWPGRWPARRCSTSPSPGR
jgi:CBS domain containing-hemolysin-like protein